MITLQADAVGIVGEQGEGHIMARVVLTSDKVIGGSAFNFDFWLAGADGAEQPVTFAMAPVQDARPVQGSATFVIPLVADAGPIRAGEPYTLIVARREIEDGDPEVRTTAELAFK